MSYNDGTIDPVSVNFLDVNGKIVETITNWTTYSIDRDFFTASDSFHLECEDDRADQLFGQIELGMQVSFAVNNCNILVGFIDNFEMNTHRGGNGKTLTISGRDRLGMLSDSSLYPNLGSPTITTSYQFQPTDTLQKVCNQILINSIGITQVNIDDDVSGLTAATGFGVGIRQKGKTGRGLTKSFTSNLAHLLKPDNGETYLSYITRIVKRCGCEIRMVPGSGTIANIAPPIYYRSNSFGDGASPFVLKRLINKSTASTNDPSLANNIIAARMMVDAKDQPSVIIAQASHGGPTFSRAYTKVICVNELTGYERKPNLQLSLTNARPSVQQGVNSLTAGSTTYSVLNPNQDLYEIIPASITGFQTTVSRPKYVVDYNSQTQEELQFFAAELMAHYQDKYFTLEYEVEGHSQKGFVWAPNLMVRVQDEILSPNKYLDDDYWLQKVVFTRSRGGGAVTRLTLKLPFTHMGRVTN